MFSGRTTTVEYAVLKIKINAKMVEKGWFHGVIFRNWEHLDQNENNIKISHVHRKIITLFYTIRIITYLDNLEGRFSPLYSSLMYQKIYQHKCII